MPEISSNRPRPKQMRSRETYEAILNSAAELFGENGFDRVTTHAVALRASVSVGGLYRYFSDKKSLLIEVYRREMTFLRGRILEEVGAIEPEEAEIRALLKKVMKMAFKAYRSRSDLLRVLSEQARKIPDLMDLRTAQENEIHEAVGRILEMAPGVTLPDRRMGAYLIRLFLESLIDNHVLYEKTPQEFDEFRLIEGAVDFLLRYVRGGTGKG